MKKATLQIEICYDCPWHTSSDGHWVCDYFDNKRPRIYGEIPDWCPLPDWDDDIDKE